MKCLHCGAEVTNGLALCELCQRFARSILDMLPVYFRNLARWRPGRAGSRQVPCSRVLYDGADDHDGTGDRISDKLDEAANMLITWADALGENRPYLVRLLDRLADAREAQRIDESQEVAWLCAGFNKYLASVATLEWCGEFVRDLSNHESALRGMTETLVPGWYAGACRQLAGVDEHGGVARCGMPTYVVPGLTWVTCRHFVTVVDDDGKRRTVDMGCGATTYARDHLDVVLDEARDWVARPKRLAEAVVALLDTEPSVPRLYARIRKWAEAERITPIRRTERGYEWSEDQRRVIITTQEVGFARYRLGEVLDLVTRRNASRASEVQAS